MHYLLITAGMIFSLICSNANAFSTFTVDFPEGMPEVIFIDYKASKGDCTVPYQKQACKVDGLEVEFAAEHFFMFMNSFIETERNQVFVENKLRNPDNYMRFSVPGQPNICHVDLNTPNIAVHLLKNGSC